MEPDQIDMMNEEELRTELRKLVKQVTSANKNAPTNPESKATFAEPSGSASGLTVILFRHPAGCLLRIEHDGGSITLDRAETWALYLELQSKIGSMPVKL